MDFTAGTQVNSVVRLVRPLGHGGMGSVWVAEHMMLKTEVVVKFMADALASDPVSLARFSREAEAAAAVKSPHVVQMLDHGFTADGTPFIVMERLDGEDLKSRLVRERVILLDELAIILSQACKALARAHAAGIVHRDIKPENIFLCHTDDGEPFVKLLDFGIAKSGAPTDFHMTQTGVTVGTPFYMSPEQAVGSPPVDATTDLWSLGVVAFEAMTGERPFDGPTLGALTMAICSELPPVPSMVDPAIPTEIDQWMAIACARDRAERFQSAKAMSDAFAAALRESTAPRPLLPVSRAVPLAFEATSESHTPAPSNRAPRRSTPPALRAPSTPSQQRRASSPPPAAPSEPATEPEPAPAPELVPSFSTTTQPLSRTPNPDGRPQARAAAASAPAAASLAQPARRSRPPLVAGGALLLAGALAAWVVASPRQRVGAPDASPVTAPSAAAATDAIPSQPTAAIDPPWRPVASADAAASSSPPSPPTAAASASAAPPRRLSSASSASSPSVVAPPPRARGAPATGSAAPVASSAPSCTPPYYFDANNVKVFKKECF